MRFKEIKYLFLILTVVACASIGRPDGGPYDEDPPVLMKSVPELYATDVKEGKVELIFDENIKLVNAFENVVVSPPQMQMPEIKSNGRRVIVCSEVDADGWVAIKTAEFSGFAKLEYLTKE
jgi:hypothetical protein